MGTTLFFHSVLDRSTFCHRVSVIKGAFITFGDLPLAALSFSLLRARVLFRVSIYIGLYSEIQLTMPLVRAARVP